MNKKVFFISLFAFTLGFTLISTIIIVNSKSPIIISTPSKPKVNDEPSPIIIAPALPDLICNYEYGYSGEAPEQYSSKGIKGTTTEDIRSFAQAYNRIRVANCLEPIAASNFFYDSCLEERLFWIAEDPSEDPLSAWGHTGTKRSDGEPQIGCDGNLAGGTGNTGAIVAQKWWDSMAHRLSLYRPSINVDENVCIFFAMTHGGLPNEPESFVRAAARWGDCVTS